MKLVVIAAAALVAGSVQAAEVKMPVDQIVQIAVGLSQMQCGNKLVRESGGEKIVCKPYDWSAAMAWQIARNLKKARDVALDYDRMAEQARANAQRDKDGNLTDKGAADVALALRARSDAQIGIDLERFNRGDLEPMNLPPAVISALLPIINE